MYTRASSIRSNYTTSTTTKAKFVAPQRNNGTSASGHPYNALHAMDDAPKNNNVLNSQFTNNNWNPKSTWLFDPAVASTNATMTNDPNEKKQCVCFPKVCYKMGNHTTTGTTATSGPAKKLLYESVASTDDIAKSGYCQPVTNSLANPIGATENRATRLSNTELEYMQTRRSVTPQTESDADDVGDAEGEVDFRKSIIRINNIYNSCREANIERKNDAHTNPFASGAHQSYHKTNARIEKDVNL